MDGTHNEQENQVCAGGRERCIQTIEMRRQRRRLAERRRRMLMSDEQRVQQREHRRHLARQRRENMTDEQLQQQRHRRKMSRLLREGKINREQRNYQIGNTENIEELPQSTSNVEETMNDSEGQVIIKMGDSSQSIRHVGQRIRLIHVKREARRINNEQRYALGIGTIDVPSVTIQPMDVGENHIEVENISVDQIHENIVHGQQRIRLSHIRCQARTITNDHRETKFQCDDKQNVERIVADVVVQEMNHGESAVENDEETASESTDEDRRSFEVNRGDSNNGDELNGGIPIVSKPSF
ncbi:uncharacterized protein LOC143875617 [Tasmannia lanceolata]|uniref:uncharacterized protein LOC143875617 n=1 Tax=Tasmannia lanceolata TaxID=3420 RepID=UPI004063F01B